MSWLEDVASLISGAGVATLNVTMFLSTAAAIPAGTGPYLLLIETGGLEPERLHTDNAGRRNRAAYARPAAQIMARGAGYVPVRNIARAAFLAVDGTYNRTINGTFYREILALQRPFDIGMDDAKRVRVVFNILGVKALS